jgi:excisionase family DNA binding protein
MEPTQNGGAAEQRRRKLDEIFAQQPYLSATMRAYQVPAAVAGCPDRIDRFAGPISVQPADAIAEARLNRAEICRVSSGAVVDAVGGIPKHVCKDNHVHPAAVWGSRDVRGNGMQFRDVMTSDEAALYLRIGTKRIRQLARSGTVPAARIGSRWRFRREALLEWLRSLEN